MNLGVTVDLNAIVRAQAANAVLSAALTQLAAMELTAYVVDAEGREVTVLSLEVLKLAPRDGAAAASTLRALPPPADPKPGRTPGPKGERSGGARTFRCRACGKVCRAKPRGMLPERCESCR